MPPENRDVMTTDVQSLLGSLTIGLGGTAGFLAVLDWMLPSARKDWVRDQASTVWIWLSYQQSWPYIRKLRNPRAFDIFCAVGVFLVLTIALVFIVGEHASVPIKVLTGVIVLIPVAVLYFVRAPLRRGLAWLTSKEAGWKILVHSLVICVVALSVGAMLVQVYNYLHENAFPASPFVTFPVAMAVAIAAIVIFMLLYALLLFTFYIVGVYLMVFLFKVSEFIVLRVAEYDKGPVLGLAALLTGVGAALQALAK
jgi:hypothetical protein